MPIGQANNAKGQEWQWNTGEQTACTRSINGSSHATKNVACTQIRHRANLAMRGIELPLVMGATT